jgi:hypothetical protein
MIFNFADDSRNLVFRKGSSSVDYEQEQYYLCVKSKYSNNYLTNITPLYSDGWDSQLFYIRLTKVDDNDNYISFSWDRNDYNGVGGVLPSEYGKEDLEGYYNLELRGTNLFPIFTKPLVTTLCKVINDWSDTIDVSNKGTRVQEDGAEYIYYRQ